MDLNRTLREHETLIRKTALRYAKRFALGQFGDNDDFVNEARIAAWRAIEAYREGRKAKLETFISVCIKRRMIDLRRHALRKSRGQLVCLGLDIEPLVDAVERALPDDEEVEDSLTLRAILDDEEHGALSHLMNGGTISALVAAWCRKKSLGSSESRCEVVACLRRIKLKLMQRGLSLSV